MTVNYLFFILNKLFFEFFHVDKQANLLQLIVDSNERSGTNDCITDDERTAQVLMFFLVGSETTGTALSHIIYILAKKKECQDRLYQEIKDADQFSFEKIIELKYLNALIDETLRLYPPIIHMPRVCVKDTELNGRIFCLVQ